MALDKLYPFTDQEPYPVPMEECVEQYDQSPSYELDAGAIFRTVNNTYMGVVVSGCS